MKFCDGFPLQARDVDTKGSCIARLVTIHGDEGALSNRGQMAAPVYQEPGGCNYHNDWQGQRAAQAA